MKKFFLIVLFIFFSQFHVAHALEITEIMYDAEGTDTDREWIEIYNDGSSSVDVSTFKLFEANTNHGLTTVQGDKNLASGAYAVIVQDKEKFKIDWPSYTGPIFDSAFSLSNDGENIALKDANLNIVSEINYVSSMGANGDGKSLQKISSTWQSVLPSPGQANINFNPVENNSTNNSTNTDTNSVTQNNTQNSGGSGTITGASKELKTTTKILSSSFGFAKNPLEIKAETKNSEGEKVFYGKYVFTFSDGSSEEYSASYFSKISHIYKYPGDYFIYLSYYNNAYDSVATATDKFLVKILEAGVFISNVGNDNDFFIEIKNNTSYENDISDWYITSENKKFIFPKNSFLSANNKIILSPEITGFVFTDKENLKLYNSTGNLIFDYGNLSQPKIKSTQISENNSAKNISKQNSAIPSIESENLVNLDDKTPVDLQANTLDVLPANKNGENFWMYFSLALFLVVFAIFAVLFLRKKEKKIAAEDDFEILP